MAIRIPVRGYYTADDVTGLSEFQSEEVIPAFHGGTGISTVTPYAIVIGYNTHSFTQLVIPDKNILMGGADDSVVATNIIDCGRVTG